MNWIKQIIIVLTFVFITGQIHANDSVVPAYVDIIFNDIEITHGDDATWGLAWAGDFQVYGLVSVQSGRQWENDPLEKKTKRTNGVFINRKKSFENVYITHRLHPDTEQFYISIKLYDYDETSGDDQIDVAPIRNENTLSFSVNTKTEDIHLMEVGGSIGKYIGKVNHALTFEGHDRTIFDEITAKLNLTINTSRFTTKEPEATIPTTPAVADSFLKTGYYKCNDGGHYYVKVQRYNFSGGTITKVFWFGEHPNGNWANVFKGQIEGNRLVGKSYDVAKGTVKGHTDLVLEINDENNFKKISGAFGGSSWSRGKVPFQLPGVRAAGFSDKNRIRSLDGAWQCSDGGIYYMRQIGNVVVWFGEGGLDRKGYAAFANVAFGTRSGNLVNLDWIDVPKGNTDGQGVLKLKVDSANQISKLSGAGFGGQTWTR